MKNETGCYSYQVSQARIKHALDVVGWKYYCLKCILYVLCSGFIFFFHLILSVTLSDFGGSWQGRCHNVLGQKCVLL